MNAAKLKKGDRLKTADGTTAVADGGTTPKIHTGWMWDLTVPGNNDHDFYVVLAAGGLQAGKAYAENSRRAVLVHNCGGVSDDLAAKADEGEIHQADFASEYESPSGATYQTHNKEFEQIPEGLKDVLREQGHPAFVCSEMKCLAQAYKAEGPDAIRGGKMTTVFVSDTEMGEHATIANPCAACRRVLSSLFVQIAGG